MKINVIQRTPVVKLSSMELGQMGVSLGPFFKGELFICTYTKMVALGSRNDGLREWMLADLPVNLRQENISILNPGDCVSITIENED